MRYGCKTIRIHFIKGCFVCGAIWVYKYYSSVLYWKSLTFKKILCTGQGTLRLKKKFSVLETLTLKIKFSVLGTLIFTRKSPILGTLSLMGKFPVLGALTLR